LSTTVTATFGLRTRLRCFTRPFAVLNRIASPSVSTHTGVSWGEPSAITVATVAIWGSFSSSTS
jgi:hypothetical protein